MNEILDKQNISYVSLLKKKGFISYLIAELLSAFSDNLYKFFLIFMITSHFDRVTSAAYISFIAAIFILPYLLFLGYAGYLSDRFPKRDVFVYVKLAEIIITTLVLIAFMIGNTTFMLVCLFLMMIRSCIFFPAKVGLLPEILDKKYLALANSLLWMSVFVAVLLGALTGGILYQIFSAQQWLVGVILIVIAIIGYLNSTLIPAKSNFIPLNKPFPINPWRDIFESVKTIRRRKSIGIAILGVGWFWFLGALVQNLLPLYGKEILHVDETYTALLQAFIGLGISAGCIVAGFLSKDSYEPGLVPFGSVGIALGTFWTAFSLNSYFHTALGLCILGFSAGLYIVPIYTFLHSRSHGHERGRIFATANYVDTLSMLSASGVYWLFAASAFKLSEDKILILFGIMTVFITVYALKSLPIFFFRLINFLLTGIFYRLNVVGLENIPDKGSVILVPNHVSYIDGLLIWAACRKRNISFMIYHKIYYLKIFHWLFKVLQYIPVHEGRRVKESLEQGKALLQKGEALCIFAEGELTRTGSLLPFRRGVEKLIEGITSKNTPIIPVYIDQVWGSIFSYERGKFFFKIPRDFPSKITISFGKPLYSGTNKELIRKKVSDLGYDSVQQRKSKDSVLPLEILKIAKKRWFSPMLTMPQTKSMYYGKLMIKVFYLIRHLKNKLKPSSTIIGVISSPNVLSVVVNIALSFMKKTIVNLSPNMSEKDLSKLCKSLNIQEILILFDDDISVSGLNVHKLDDRVLRTNPVISFFMGAGIILCPNKFLLRTVLNNDVGPDDAVAILSEHHHQPVYVTHYNILSNTEGFAQLLFMRHNDWILSEASYGSSVGFIGQLWYPLLNAVGIACTNINQENLTIPTINALMKHYKITLLISHSDFYRKILKSGQSLTFPKLRFAVAVGMEKDASIYSEFEEKIHVELFEGFGLPELPLVVSLNHYNYIDEYVKQMGLKKGSFGKPLPGMQLEIIDPETQEILTAEKEGILRIKGPNIPINISTENGWIMTQHRAMMDKEGFLYLIS